MQDDDPYTDPNPKAKKSDDEENDEENQESFMYFIRTGQFEVSIKSTQSGEQTDSFNPKVFKKQLYDGDHFGEIGLIFETKRTASVKSLNYGSLARLS